MTRRFRHLLLFIFTFLAIVAVTNAQDLTVNGGTHSINWSIDGNLIITGGAEVLLESGASVLNNVLISDNGSTFGSILFIMEGSSVQQEIQATDYTTIYMLGGSIGGIKGIRHSYFYIYEGSIGTAINLDDHAIVEIYGGSIGTSIKVEDRAFVEIYGGDFSVDGGATLLPNYYYLSNAGLALTLQGVLQDGSVFNTAYDLTLARPGDGDIIVIVISVPDVAGMSQLSATATITDQGYIVGTITQQYDSIVAAGSVISQDPLADAIVTPGSAIDLIVSIGPCKLPFDTNNDCLIDLTDIANIASVWLIDCNITPNNPACI